MSINFASLDLNLLRLLVKIHALGSVSLAGAELGLSQPASSNALARLRDALEDPLFVRTRDGMVPTTYCEAVAPQVAAHLAAIDAALGAQADFDPATSTQAFLLSLSGLGEAAFLPPLARRVFAQAPQVRLINAAAPLPDLLPMLERGEVDVALGIVDVAGRGVRSFRLFEDDYAAVAGGGLAEAPSSLGAARILLAAPSATYATNVEEALARNGLADRIVLRLRHFGAVPELLDDHPIVAVLPRGHARRLQAAGRARVLPLSVPVGRDRVRMVWHQRTENDPGCAWLRDQIRALFARD